MLLFHSLAGHLVAFPCPSSLRAKGKQRTWSMALINLLLSYYVFNLFPLIRWLVALAGGPFHGAEKETVLWGEGRK